MDKEELAVSYPIELFLAALIAFAVLFLSACDGEVERLQAQADWQAKVTHACIPQKGELVTIRQLGKESYTVRRYRGGLIATDIVTRDEE